MILFGQRSLFLVLLLAWLPLQASNSEIIFKNEIQHARRFLCERDFCIQQLPNIKIEEVNNYLGYVDRETKQISISPNLDEVDTQLALIHELTHVYRAQKNPNEEIWLNEGLAKFMEYQYSNVWPVSYIERLKKNPRVMLSDYGPGGDGYPASFFLFLYLYNHYGQEKFLAKVLNSEKSGWKNVLEAAKETTPEIEQELITKESILRHFAVSIWMNDPFAAKYALFSLDKNYEALRVSAAIETPPANSLSIQYSPKFEQAPNAKEIYSIMSYDPFVIKTSEPQDKALVYIYIFEPSFSLISYIGAPQGGIRGDCRTCETHGADTTRAEREKRN